MPELPEVQTVVDSLRPSLLGAVITRVMMHRHDIVQPNDVNLVEKLTGRRVSEITRRGKREWVEDAWFGLMRQIAWYVGARAGMRRGRRVFRGEAEARRDRGGIAYPEPPRP